MSKTLSTKILSNFSKFMIKKRKKGYQGKLVKDIKIVLKKKMENACERSKNLSEIENWLSIKKNIIE